MTSGVLLDLSGVLYEGDTAIPGAVNAVKRLRRSNLPVRFLTNTTRRPQRTIVVKLVAMGFKVEASEILIAAAATCD